MDQYDENADLAGEEWQEPAWTFAFGCFIMVALCCTAATAIRRKIPAKAVGLKLTWLQQHTAAARSAMSNRDENTDDDAVNRLARITECSICFEGYSADVQKRMPRALPCGHTFCEGCLSSLLAPLAGTGKHKPLACPTCRIVTKVPHGRANGLMANWAVIR